MARFQTLLSKPITLRPHMRRPYKLEQQLRTAQARLMAAKGNLDAARMARDSCAQIEAAAAAVLLVEDAPHSALAVVQERGQLAWPSTITLVHHTTLVPRFHVNLGTLDGDNLRGYIRTQRGLS